MNKVLLPIFTAGTAVMLYVMSVTGKDLKTPVTPHGIINLELASNKIKVEEIYREWVGVGQADRLSKAKQNTYYDFIFILLYAPFLFLCCTKLIKKHKDSPIFKTGKIAATSALFAGVFDILENLGMLQSLNGNISDTIAKFTFTVSVIKWSLVIIALLFITSMLLYKLAKRNTLHS